MTEPLFRVLSAGLAACGMSLLGMMLVRSRTEWTRRHALALTGFAGGVVTGAALLHLLPEAVEQTPLFYVWLAVGFLVLLVFERQFTPHIHADHVHEPGDCEGPRATLGVMASLGFGLHAAFDGLALGVTARSTEEFAFSTAVAVVAHKIPEGVAVFTLLLHSGRTVAVSQRVAVIVAFVTPLFAFLSFALVGTRILAPATLGMLTSLVAGAFIYIGVADLIPEAMRGRRWRNTGWVLTGVALMAAVLLLEHGH